MRQPSVMLISGIPASGKSSVAQALAERLPRSAHVRGDVYRRMVVGGRAEMGSAHGDEALRQLRLRYELAAATADRYAAAGFTAVVQDVVLGAELPRFAALGRTRPLYVVVLAPPPDVVADRDARRLAERGKTGYADWTPAQLDAGLRDGTPRMGLWLDTGGWSVSRTVDEILARAESGALAADTPPTAS